MAMSELSVESLRVSYRDGAGESIAVRDISFRLNTSKTALIGESGSGKTSVGRALVGLLPNGAKCSAKRMQLDEVDMTDLSPAGWRELRGGRIGMILQDPKHCLNPSMRIGRQIVEARKTHFELRKTDQEAFVIDALSSVRIRDPERVATLYPHQLSGGMGQRVMIAMALASEPDLLIADEPTSAIDAELRREILSLLDDIVSARDLRILMISHDLGLVAQFCQHAFVMKDGQIVEDCASSELAVSRHPYVRRLLSAAPRLPGGSSAPSTSVSSDGTEDINDD